MSAEVPSRKPRVGQMGTTTLQSSRAGSGQTDNREVYLWVKPRLPSSPHQETSALMWWSWRGGHPHRFRQALFSSAQGVGIPCDGF